MARERFQHRQAQLAVAVFDLLDELLRFVHVLAHPQPDQHEHDAEHERQAPAHDLNAASPSVAQDRHDARGQHEADAVADLHAAAVERLLLLRRAFDGHQRRAAPFAADRETLDRAHQHQQHGRPPADRRERRQQADRDRRQPHQHHGQHQHPLAAEPVAVVAEHDAAERPEQEADAEGRERRERAHRRADFREELGIEYQRGDDPVQQEVVPVDDSADEAADRGLAGLAARGRRLRRRGCRRLGSWRCLLARRIVESWRRRVRCCIEVDE